MGVFPNLHKHLACIAQEVLELKKPLKLKR